MPSCTACSSSTGRKARKPPEMRERLTAWLVPRLIRWAYAFLSASIRWEWVGRPPRDDLPRLYMFWHARLLMLPYPFLHGLLGEGGGRMAGYVMISEHRDGQMIADVTHMLGLRTVRGSATRGGARALLQMIRLARREDVVLALTPDGPRGPRERVKPGIIQLARRSGRPLTPICYATSRFWRVNSWDRFYIPRPFSRGVFVIGEPVHITESDDPDEALARAQRAMDETQRRADSYFREA